MGKTMEDRKKAGTLTDKWTKIKGSHKELSNTSIFKPDITGVLRSYDLGLTNYDKLIEQKKKLSEAIGSLNDEMNTQIQASKKLKAEVDKIDDSDREVMGKNVDLLNKYKADPDSAPADVLAAFDALINAANERTTMDKALWDRILAHDSKRNTLIKKSRDDYKAKADAVTNGLKKLETEGDKFEAQIRQILLGYQKIATQQDKADIVEDVRGLLGSL
jgi:hypothetical protein